MYREVQATAVLWCSVQDMQNTVQSSLQNSRTPCLEIQNKIWLQKQTVTERQL